MAAAEQKIRLEVETRGLNVITDLRKQLDLADGSVTALTDAFKRGDVTLEQYRADIAPMVARQAELANAIRVGTAELDRLEAQTKQSGTAFDFLANSATKAADKLDVVAQKGRNTSQLLLNAGRFTQDFAQGGFAGVLNNVEGLFTSLGGSLSKLAGPATAVATVGYLIYTNWSLIEGLWTKKNPFPEVASGAERFAERLKNVNTELDELKKKTSLNNEQLARWNSLKSEQVRVQEQLNRVKEHEAQLDALSKLKPDDQQERASKVKALIANEGGDKKLKGALTQVMGEQTNVADRERLEKLGKRDEATQRRIADFRAKQAAGPVDQDDVNDFNRDLAQHNADRRKIAAAAQRIKEGQEGVEGAAADLMRRAAEGDDAAIKQINKLIDKNPKPFGPGMAQGMGMADADQQELEKQGDQNAQNIGAKLKAKKEGEARKAKAKKQIDKWADEGADELEFEEKQEEDAKKEEAKERHEQAKVDAEHRKKIAEARKKLDADLAASYAAEDEGSFFRNPDEQQRRHAEFDAQRRRGLARHFAEHGSDQGEAEFLAGKTLEQTAPRPPQPRPRPRPERPKVPIRPDEPLAAPQVDPAVADRNARLRNQADAAAKQRADAAAKLRADAAARAKQITDQQAQRNAGLRQGADQANVMPGLLGRVQNVVAQGQEVQAATIAAQRQQAQRMLALEGRQKMLRDAAAENARTMLNRGGGN